MSSEREDSTKREKRYDEEWRQMFTDPSSELNKKLQEFRDEHTKMQATTRCCMCLAPFDGAGHPLKGREPNPRNPTICKSCDGWMEANYPGRVLHTCPVISVDMRGSSVLARRHTKDRIYLDEYQKPFMAAATQALFDNDGFIENFRGDEVRGLYPEGFSSKNNSKKAWNTAILLLRKPPRKPDGSVIDFGVAIHIGDNWIASEGTPPQPFLGCIITGDGINTVSHICGSAKAGEALISEATFEAIGMSTNGLERRLVLLKGDDEPEMIPVYAVTAESEVAAFHINS
jgi:adenylate cyclase